MTHIVVATERKVENSHQLIRWTCACGKVSRWLQERFQPQSVSQHARGMRS